MKNFIFILLLLLTSCGNNNNQQPIPDSKSDSTEQLVINYNDVTKELTTLKEKYSSIVTDNIELKIEIKKKIQLIDTLMNKTVKYQNKYIELKIISDEIKKISNSNAELIKITTKENEILKDREDSMRGVLEVEQQNKNIVLSENKVLKSVIKKANILIPTGVVITPYYITKNIFTNKEKKNTTFIANKIKFIQITFSLPANSICVKGSYSFRVSIYDAPENKTLKKEMTVDYKNLELPVTILFDDTKIIYKKGIKKILIKNDNTVVYQNDIEFK